MSTASDPGVGFGPIDHILEHEENLNCAQNNFDGNILKVLKLKINMGYCRRVGNAAILYAGKKFIQKVCKRVLSLHYCSLRVNQFELTAYLSIHSESPDHSAGIDFLDNLESHHVDAFIASCPKPCQSVVNSFHWCN